MTDIDPQIRAVLDAMAAQPQPDEPPSLEEVRAGASAGHRALCPPLVQMAVIAERVIPGPNGDIPCIVNKPHRSDEPLPVLVYFHGGGLMLLGADEFQPLCTALGGGGRLHRRQRRLPAGARASLPATTRRRGHRLPVVPRARGGDRRRCLTDRGRRRQCGRLSRHRGVPRCQAAGSSAADPPTARLSRHRRSESVREHGDDRRVRQPADDRLDACRACRRRPHQPARLPDPRRRPQRARARDDPRREPRPARRSGSRRTRRCCGRAACPSPTPATTA